MINILQSCGRTVSPETISNNSVCLHRPQAAASQPHSASSIWCSAGLPTARIWDTCSLPHATAPVHLIAETISKQDLPSWHSDSDDLNTCHFGKKWTQERWKRNNRMSSDTWTGWLKLLEECSIAWHFPWEQRLGQLARADELRVSGRTQITESEEKEEEEQY